MTQRKWSYRQTLAITLLPLLITNGAQWATARAKSETRDESLLRAFQTSVQALEDARDVLAHAEARIAKCEARGGAKSMPRTESSPLAPQIMMERGTLALEVQQAPPSLIARAVAWATTPPLATAILNDIAQQHEVKQ